MNQRSGIARDLLIIEQEMKDLEIRYEQYFAGVEKREPVRDRESLAGKIRRLSNRHIVQTDLRFRTQGLSTRFHTYCGYWDRILRLMDEGRFSRGASAPPPPIPRKTPGKPAPSGKTEQENIDQIYQKLVEAHQSCNLPGAPDRDKVAAFLGQQAEKIREKFGEREVEFRVELEGGKPKIKVRAKQ